jgi:hypothetical protein
MSPGGWTISPLVATVQTPSHSINMNKTPYIRNFANYWLTYWRQIIPVVSCICMNFSVMHLPCFRLWIRIGMEKYHWTTSNCSLNVWDWKIRYEQVYFCKTISSGKKIIHVLCAAVTYCSHHMSCKLHWIRHGLVRIQGSLVVQQPR